MSKDWKHIDGSSLRYVALVEQLPSRWLPANEITRRAGGDDPNYVRATLRYAERKGLVEKRTLELDGTTVWRPIPVAALK